MRRKPLRETPSGVTYGQSDSIDCTQDEIPGEGGRGGDGRFPIRLTKLTFDSCELTEVGWNNGNKLMRNILITIASRGNCVNLLLRVEQEKDAFVKHGRGLLLQKSRLKANSESSYNCALALIYTKKKARNKIIF